MFIDQENGQEETLFLLLADRRCQQVVQWGQAVCRWVLVLAFYYGHHAIYVGPKRLTGYRQVCLPSSTYDSVFNVKWN